MSPKPDVSQERKQQIMDAALKVFSREGLHTARMDDIAEEAGLSKGALYWYFNSKDKIIASLLTNFFDREFSKIEEWVMRDDSARNLLQSLIDLIVEDLLSVKPFMSILYEFWAMSFRNKRIGKFIRESMHRYLDLIIPVVQRGIDQGEFKALDATDVAMAFGSIIEGSILLWSYDMNNVDFRALITKSVSIFLDGIECDDQG
ncbi:MAG: TetR/AcrR family transcriptional regulator [Anaerolineales bacterium]